MLYGEILNFLLSKCYFRRLSKWKWSASRKLTSLVFVSHRIWHLMQYSMTSARATSFALLLLDSILTPWKRRNSKINSPRAGSLFPAECQLRRQNNFPRICTSEPARRLHFVFFSNSLNPLQKGLNLGETGPSHFPTFVKSQVCLTYFCYQSQLTRKRSKAVENSCSKQQT